jgi:hypothetical protein
MTRSRTVEVDETCAITTADLLSRFDQFQIQLDYLTDLLRVQVADWLTLEHAALVCDCSYDHIYRAVQAGQLSSSDIGNGGKKASWRIARTDLKVWMDRNKGGGLAPPRSDLKNDMERYLPGVA